MRRSLLPLLAFLLLCAAPAGATPAPPWSHEGRWSTDAQGRAVLFRGVNLVNKFAPYTAEALGFGADDARFLRDNGLTNVRLGFAWKAVEPAPGVYDRAYLDSLVRTTRLLGRFGITVMVDNHQDLFNERFGGQGFPDWATLDDNLPVDPKGEDLGGGHALSYPTSPALNQAYESLNTNRVGPGGVGLQDRMAAMWQEVARAFVNEPNVMSYDLYNEPWAGFGYTACGSPAGCAEHEQTRLGPMMAKLTAAIRAVDTVHPVFYEGDVLHAIFGSPSAMPASGDANTGLSFHDYCGYTCSGDAVERSALANADANGDPTLLSEFGAGDDPASLTRVLDIADRDLLSWQYWHYCGCPSTTTPNPAAEGIVNDPFEAPVGDNVRAKIKLLAAPYPAATAGTPLRTHVDRATGTYDLTYSTDPPGPHTALDRRAQTEVPVPAATFGTGATVRVRNARVVSPVGARTLRMVNRPGAREVGLHLEPGCRDTAAPRLTATRHGRLVRGRSTDGGCGVAGAPAARVEVAVARRTASGCRFARAGGGFGPVRRCGRPVFALRAVRRGTAFRLPLGRLASGRDRVAVRAVDLAGNRRVVRLSRR